ncbi:glycoside hydrolase family 2 protein [Paenibacillus hodogayensis]|uniref:Glycoside hydrolase family 2 protein n=1 Tax=Paenibacillus hodogayensis TaxID=279208 RepID=A0ABV5VVE6_9BACL
MRTRVAGIPVNAVVRGEARSVFSLDGTWKLKLDPANRGMAEQWASRPLETEQFCSVPGGIQSVKELAEPYPSVVGMQNGYLGTAWLECGFGLPEAFAGGRQVWIKFGGVAPAAHIWMNGQYVGYHSHAPVSAKWNVTDLVSSGEGNRVTVAVVEEDKGMLGGLRFGEMFWSGVYRSVEIEAAGDIRLENVYLRPDEEGKRLIVEGVVCNDRSVAVQVVPAFRADWRANLENARLYRAEQIEVRPGEQAPISFAAKLPDTKRWSCGEPHLYTMSVVLLEKKQLIDEYRTRLGIRHFGPEGAALRLNGKPFMARGVGQEYFSPTIAPLVDRELIRARFRSVKEHGFNFVRYHTYTPTPEELDIADELGLLLVSEISLVSNFGKTFPVPEGLELLREHIVQTRNHPSLGMYGLGNEGSQLMIIREDEREHARAGYAAIKRHAPGHPAIIAFGMQGELPGLPNDAETPHLWSHQFLWAYDGLSRIPWRALAPLAAEKPCIVHEYGKFGVWPDAAEESLYPPDGFAASFGVKGRKALQAAGIGEWETAIIANSRKLAFLCNTSAIEQARRQPNVDGYVMWTFFRHGGRNAGYVDDMGGKPDFDPALYREGCNAPLAVLIDRDFDRRTWFGGEQIEIGVHLSNYSGSALRGAIVEWRIGDSGETWLEGRFEVAGFADGRNGPAGSIRGIVPVKPSPAKIGLSIRVRAGERIVSANRWDFWAFPLRRRETETMIACDFADAAYARSFRSRVPGAVRLADLDSMVRGCRSWAGPDYAATLESFRPQLFVADRFGEEARLMLGHGIPVLLLDTGCFGDDWYPATHPSGTNGFDYYRQFSSFRAGWDKGNIATIVHDDPLLGDFPHEGYCDAQFYSMVQEASPLRLEAVAGTIGVRGAAVVRSVPRMQTEETDSVILQDPNARNEQKQWIMRQIATEDRAYLLKTETAGVQLAVCSLRLFDDPAGSYMLDSLLEGMIGDPA